MWDVVRELMLEEVHRVWRRLWRRGRHETSVGSPTTGDREPLPRGADHESPDRC